MTSLNYQSFPELLRSKVKGFDRVYDEHLRDNDEVLHHMLLGDLVRFLLEIGATGKEGRETTRCAVQLMEDALSSSDENLQELIGVSFVENLEPSEQGVRAVRKFFGPRLTAAYAIMWGNA